MLRDPADLLIESLLAFAAYYSSLSKRPEKYGQQYPQDRSPQKCLQTTVRSSAGDFERCRTGAPGHPTDSGCANRRKEVLSAPLNVVGVLMYIVPISGSPDGPEKAAVGSELLNLCWRERQIAEAIYKRGLLTASEVLAFVDGPITNAALRSMLNRLVKKGLLTKHGSGRQRPHVYGPAITLSSSKDEALKQFAMDFYQGSLSDLADSIADLFEAKRSGPVGRGRSRLVPKFETLRVSQADDLDAGNVTRATVCARR